jgi:1,4-dihydroxy-2-naphthoate octaprenyltransferase
LSIKSFLQFVEIQTKTASVIPFALGTLLAVYHYDAFNAGNFLIMLISLLAFDMATTAINNYLDHQRAIQTAGFNYAEKNAMVKYGISNASARITISSLLVVAVAAGVLLTCRTNLVVLAIGMVSFAAGVLYTFGPIPLSRMPLGEIFSGFFMGFVILFLAVYIHVFDQQLVTLTWPVDSFALTVNIRETAAILLFSIPTIAGIANIMLANNICDLDEDIVNHRFTLPYYIGRARAHRLFAALYYLGFGSIVLAVALRIVPFYSLLTLLTWRPVYLNIQAFRERPYKGETFVLAVKNFVMVNTAEVIILGAVLVLRSFCYRQ